MRKLARVAEESKRGGGGRASAPVLGLPLARLACLFCLVVVCSALWSAPARAQGNFDGRLLGGRTSMMGGAGVAMGSDQATAFINPAGITRIPGQKFAFSTFVAQIDSRRVKNYFDPSTDLNLEGATATDLGLRVIPNTFCLFLDGPPKDSYSGRSRHKFAACGADTEREEYFFARNTDGQPAAGIDAGLSNQSSMQFRRSSFVLTWGMQLTERLSMGTNFRLDYSALTTQISTTSFLQSGQTAAAIMADVNRNSWSWDSSVTVGMTYRLFDGVTMGASISTPSQHMFGSHTSSTSVSTTSMGEALLVQDKGDFRYNNPGGLRFGMAFSWPRFNFEVDAAFYGPQAALASAVFERQIKSFENTSINTQDEGRAAVIERGQPVTNLFAGFEYFMDSNFSLIGGVNTDFSALTKRTETSLADSLFTQRKHAIYASIGVMSYGRAGSLLLGFRSHYGWGELLAPQVISSTPRFVAQEQRDFTLALVVSGQINFRAVRDTALRAIQPLGRIPQNAESTPSQAPEPSNPYQERRE